LLSPTIDPPEAGRQARDLTTATRVAANRAALRATVGPWVIHDLRSPVQAVALIGDMLAEDETSIDSSLRAILKDNARRMRELLDALTWLFEPPAAGDAQPVPLSAVITTVAAVLRSYRGPVKLDIDTAAFAQLPAVRGTLDGFVQLVLNLIVNALQAQHDRPQGAIRVRAWLTEHATVVQLAVEDDGPGLPADVSVALSTPSGGPEIPSGLGLTVSQALVRQWGGSLAARQPMSGGACIEVTLPVWRMAP
jgi:signal transduction histidine kinase